MEILSLIKCNDSAKNKIKYSLIKCNDNKFRKVEANCFIPLRESNLNKLLNE
jgi:hypothetical protein